MRDKELVKGPWKSFSVESQASLLHPLPCQGVVVIGYETVSYYNKEVQHAIDPPIIKVPCLSLFLFPSLPSSLPPFLTLSLSISPSQESIISCVGQIDASRYLLGDANGRLLMLFVDSEEKMDAEETVVTSMRIEVLGEVLIRSS